VKGITSLDFCPYFITVQSLVFLSIFGKTVVQHICIPRQATFTMGRGGASSEYTVCPNCLIDQTTN